MAGVFAVTKINYLMVNLFVIWRGPFFVYIRGIKFFGYAICLVSGVATKAAIPFQKSITIL